MRVPSPFLPVLDSSSSVCRHLNVMLDGSGRAGRCTLHMQNWERATARICWRPPDHREPERLVEPQCGNILLVDIDRQYAPTQSLRVGHKEPASPLPLMVRVDGQRFNRATGEAQKPDRGPSSR